MKFAVLPIVLTLMLIGYFGMLCGIDDTCAFASFFSPLSFTFFKPLWVYALFFIPVPLVLFFVRENVWKSWLRFSYWWIALSFIVVAITPVWSSSWFPLYSFVKEDAAQVMGGLFTIISLILIAWKSIATRRSKLDKVAKMI